MKSVTGGLRLLYEHRRVIEEVFKASLGPDVTLDVPANREHQEVPPVSLETLREFIFILWAKYQSLTSRKEKAAVLDAITTTLGIHRKSALRLMTAGKAPRMRMTSGSTRCSYSSETKEWFVRLWNAMGRMSSRKMKAALPKWLPYYVDFEIPKRVRAELLRMGTTTMDTILKPIRARQKRKQNTGTWKAKIRTEFPLRPLGLQVDKPGVVEVDTVMHCGDSASGVFANTVTMTDIHTGWTECVAILGKEASGIRDALLRLERRMPFPLRVICSDNGAEFLNHTVVDEFVKSREVPISLFRGRPYRKNDQAHVEQKNFTNVRQAFGYERIDTQRAVDLMNQFYESAWNDLQNYYVPQAKTLHKERVGSQMKRVFSFPSTPIERLLDSDILSEHEIGQLAEKEHATNPFELKKLMRELLFRLSKHFSFKKSWPGRFSHG